MDDEKLQRRKEKFGAATPVAESQELDEKVVTLSLSLLYCVESLGWNSMGHDLCLSK